MRALLEEKKYDVIAHCRMGVAHMKCQNCWLSLNLHTLGFVESVFLMWSLQGEGAQEASTLLNNESVNEPSQLVD